MTFVDFFIFYRILLRAILLFVRKESYKVRYACRREEIEFKVRASGGATQKEEETNVGTRSCVYQGVRGKAPVRARVDISPGASEINHLADGSG